MSEIDPHLQHIYDEKPEDGKFYIELPFGGRKEVTEEEFNERAEKKTAYEEEENRKRELAAAFAKEVHEAGFHDILDHHLHTTHSDRYKQRLLEIMKQQGLKHIGEAGQHSKLLEDAEKVNNISGKDSSNIPANTAIDIFNTLQPALTQHTDIYTHRLDALFAECESTVARKRVSVEQYDEILSLFELSHINDPASFLRFENLKKADTKYYYQRIFRFGRNYADGLPLGDLPEEKEIISYNSLYAIRGGLWHKSVTMDDLEPDVEKFHKKVRASYKYVLKEKMGGHWDPLYSMTLSPEPVDLYDQMSEKEKDDMIKEGKKVTSRMPTRKKWNKLLTYERNRIVLWMKPPIDPFFNPIGSRMKNELTNPVNSYHMQEIFGFQRDELNEIVEETKHEFMHEFPHFFQTVSFSDIDKEGSIVNINEIYAVRMARENAAPAYGLHVADTRKILEEGLIRCMREGMKEIRDKIENPGEKKNGKLATRSRRMALDNLYAAMCSLGMQHELLDERKANAKELKEKLQGAKKLAYAQKKGNIARKKYNLPDAYTSEVFDQILAIVNDKLPAAIYRKIENQQRAQMGGLPYGRLIPNRRYTKLINDRVLLHEGLFGYMKFILQDEVERKAFWDKIKEASWKEFFYKLQHKLMNPESADPKSMMLIDPVVYQLRKYGVGTKDLKMNRRAMKKNTFSYIINCTDKELEPYFVQIEKYLQGNSKKEPRKIHHIFFSISNYLYSLIGYCQSCNHRAKTNSTIDRWDERRNVDYFAYNMDNFSGQYPGDYLMKLAIDKRSPDEMYELLPHDIIDAIIHVYRRSESLKKQFFAQMVQAWVQLNAMPGGKLQRIIEEQCVGMEDREEAQAYAIGYILENTEDIVIRDFTISLLGRESIAPISDASKALIKELVSEVLTQRKEKIGQKSLEDKEQQTLHTNKK